MVLMEPFEVGQINLKSYLEQQLPVSIPNHNHFWGICWREIARNNQITGFIKSKNDWAETSQQIKDGRQKAEPASN